MQCRQAAACTLGLWPYLHTQLLNHYIDGLVNVLLDSCTMLILKLLFTERPATN